MDNWLTGIGAITLFTEDLAASNAFYQGALGLTPVFEDAQSAAYALGDTMINVLQADHAHELIAPAPVAAPDAGSRVQLTVWVADTDAVCADLAKRGVPLLNGPIDRPWGVRTAAFADPAGHVWEVAQGLNNPAATPPPPS
jgi:catechol 2,3-dioxygenase-like lactoylglutathione lyase family enzyme